MQAKARLEIGAEYFSFAARHIRTMHGVTARLRVAERLTFWVVPAWLTKQFME
jgi:hypothetical protein